MRALTRQVGSVAQDLGRHQGGAKGRAFRLGRDADFKPAGIGKELDEGGTFRQPAVDGHRRSKPGRLNQQCCDGGGLIADAFQERLTQIAPPHLGAKADDQRCGTTVPVGRAKPRESGQKHQPAPDGRVFGKSVKVAGPFGQAGPQRPVHRRSGILHPASTA